MLINEIAYNHNKKVWHNLFNPFNKYQLHHIFPKSSYGGVARCCLHLFYPAENGHQDNWQFVESLKAKFLDHYVKARDNFDWYDGCKKQIFKECKYCYFFREKK